MENKPALQLNAVPVPVEGFQIQSLDGEMVLLHPSQNFVLHINQTGALIWQLCDGARSLSEMIEILIALYPDAAGQIPVDVFETIQGFIRQGAMRQR